MVKLAKGSQEAKEYMAKIRGMKKGKSVPEPIKEEVKVETKKKRTYKKKAM